MIAREKKQKKYKIKTGARELFDHTKGQIYGEAIERISQRHRGKLSPELVVEEARPRTSPLHDAFEWNDRIAADSYRKSQAKCLISAIVIVEEVTGDEIQAFHDVKLPAQRGESKTTYIPISKVEHSADLQQQLLEQAYEYLEWFRNKFSQVKELQPLLVEIDDFLLNPKFRKKDGIPTEEFEKYLVES